MYVIVSFFIIYCVNTFHKFSAYANVHFFLSLGVKLVWKWLPLLIILTKLKAQEFFGSIQELILKNNCQFFQKPLLYTDVGLKQK